jgi:hypothetical protein
VCGAKLGLTRRLAGKSLCETHEAEKRASDDAELAAHQAAGREYIALASSVATDTAAVDRLPALAVRAGMTPAEQRRGNMAAVTGLVATALQDAYLSEDEETALDKTIALLDVTDAEQTELVRPYARDLMIARLNAGRLPTIESPEIFLKPREVAHIQVGAALLKQVVHRETRGGYSGWSFPIYKGIRYRVGSFAARSVVIGTSMEIADTGILCITSQRAVFKGMSQSVECLYAKLVGINVFDDGIQFHVANRKNATTLRVGDGHLVAAMVNAAIHPAGVAP